MRRFLSYQDQNGRQNLAELGGGPPLLVGRDARCQIQFSDPTLSSEHCRILCEGEHGFVEDLGSTNGTYVNERRVASRQRQELKPDDRIRCGVLRLQLVVAVQADAITQTGVRPAVVSTPLLTPAPAPVSDETARLSAQCAALDTSLVETRRQLELQQRSRSKTQEELQRAIQCIRLLQGEREQLQREFETRQKELLDVRAEARELKLLIDSARRQSAQAAAHWQGLVSKADAVAARADQERNQVLAQSTQLAAECDSLKRVSTNQEQQLTNLRAELLAARQRLDDLLPTIDRTERQLAELRTHSVDALRKAVRRGQDAQAEAQQYRQECERLRRLVERSAV